MDTALATALELHSLGMQFHDLSISLGLLAQQLLDSEEMAFRPIGRGEFDELSHAAASMRLIARGATSLIEEQGVPF